MNKWKYGLIIFILQLPFIIYSQSLPWRNFDSQLSGSDRVPLKGIDIGVGGNRGGITTWLISGVPDPLAAGCYKIYWFNALFGTWINVPGCANRVDVDGNGYPWVVSHWNGHLAVSKDNGATWGKIDAPSALDIGVNEKGDVWIIGQTTNNGCTPIYRMKNGKFEQVMPPICGANRIDVDADGNAWVVKKNGEIYKFNGTNWDLITGQLATDITVSPSGTVYITSKTYTPPGNNVYIYNGNNNWSFILGGLESISANSSELWGVNKFGSMFGLKQVNDIPTDQVWGIGKSNQWKLTGSKQEWVDLGRYANGEEYENRIKDNLFRKLPFQDFTLKTTYENAGLPAVINNNADRDMQKISGTIQCFKKLTISAQNYTYNPQKAQRLVLVADTILIKGDNTRFPTINLNTTYEGPSMIGFLAKCVIIEKGAKLHLVSSLQLTNNVMTTYEQSKGVFWLSAGKVIDKNIKSTALSEGEVKNLSFVTSQINYAGKNRDVEGVFKFYLGNSIESFKSQMGTSINSMLNATALTELQTIESELRSRRTQDEETNNNNDNNNDRTRTTRFSLGSAYPEGEWGYDKIFQAHAYYTSLFNLNTASTEQATRYRTVDEYINSSKPKESFIRHLDVISKTGENIKVPIVATTSKIPYKNYVLPKRAILKKFKVDDKERSGVLVYNPVGKSKIQLFMEYEFVNDTDLADLARGGLKKMGIELENGVPPNFKIDEKTLSIGEIVPIGRKYFRFILNLQNEKEAINIKDFFLIGTKTLTDIPFSIGSKKIEKDLVLELPKIDLANPLEEFDKLDNPALTDVIQIKNALAASKEGYGALDVLEVSLEIKFEGESIPIKRGPFRLSSARTMGDNYNIPFLKKNEKGFNTMVTGRAYYTDGFRDIVPFEIDEHFILIDDLRLKGN
jgi:Tectonin domain